MPTHLDVLCGNYRDVLVYNQKAIVADRQFLAREGALNVYALYRTHDYHFAMLSVLGFKRSLFAGVLDGGAYSGHQRRGVVARCRRPGGREYGGDACSTRRSPRVTAG